MLSFDSYPLFRHLHLLGVEALAPEDIDLLLEQANLFLSSACKTETLGSFLYGKTQLNLFYEASTRTRCSFELAGKRLGMDVIDVSPETSSMQKGESFLDTLRILDAMKPNLLVLRHPSSGAAAFAASHMHCQVINAGDGTHEHPTQSLLDALTIKRAKGKISGLNILICGDILHSRVARSNILLLNKMGAHVRVAGPSVFLPEGIEHMGVRVFRSISLALEDIDVIIALRVQKERMDSLLYPSCEEYFHDYGIDNQKLAMAKSDVLVMHPGPVNRGVEIASDVMDSSKSLILQQVETGVAVRMSVLCALLNPARKAGCLA